MNLTFIIEGGTATERHILEHLFLMRTKNFPEPRSLEINIRTKTDDKNFDNFHSYLDYTECTFLSIPTETSELILKEYKTWYFTKEDFENTHGEFLIFVKAFDDMFSNTVVARSSYTFKEIVYGAKFNPMYNRNEAGSVTILDLGKLNSFTEVDISERNKTAGKAVSN